jgi:hypothetical protein
VQAVIKILTTDWQKLINALQQKILLRLEHDVGAFAAFKRGGKLKPQKPRARSLYF